MNRLFFIFVCILVVLPLCARAAGMGTIKVMAPTSDCLVFIDDVPMDLDAGNIVTAQVPVGMHSITVAFKDGAPILKKNFTVNEGEITMVNVSHELKGSGGAVLAPVRMETGATNRNNLSEEDNWGTGWGLSIGADNTNYAPSLYGYSEYIDIGAQYDASVFYAGEISKDTYFDLALSVYRTAGSFKNALGTTTYVSSAPLCANLKFKLNDSIMLGVGLNYSYWSLKTSNDSLDTSPGIGYQVFMELRPLSSEIGYIIKSASASEFGETMSFTSSGFYFKYKFYIWK